MTLSIRRFLALVLLLGLFPRVAEAQSTAQGVVPLQALLAVAGLLSTTVLIVSLFTLWQSHRTYVETVRLQQAIAEAQQTFLGQAWSATRSGPPPMPKRPPQAVSAQPPVAQAPRKAPPAPVAPPAPALPTPPPAPASTARGQNGGESDPFTGLSDVEFAVLQKLVSDPGFFTHHSLEGFGASQFTIDTLLREGFAKLDGLGRPAVPAEVRAALKQWAQRKSA